MLQTLWDTNPTPDLTSYDLILLNTSAGKDSQATMDVMVDLAREREVTDRLLAVHCDLGRVEWPGTKELAAEQAQRYDLPFQIARNRKYSGDLLGRIENRGKWPDRGNRYCTSEFKTGPVKRLCTRLVREKREAGMDRQVRILNCLGIRASESPARAARHPFKHLDNEDHNTGWTNGLRWVDEWLPIFTWDETDVWDRIRASGVPHHPAYDQGMPRLSCSFCVLAGKSALVRAAQLRPELAQEYLALEQKMDFRFKDELSMADIIAAAQTETVTTIDSWNA
jgi:3'-phosphoadenosine 5'-phosphosulfate sulfotransferase (PAPS reductase)/FAD synthetase